MQKFINVLVVVLVGFAIYFGIIVDNQRVQNMVALEESDLELQGHKNAIDEEYRRLNLQFIGRGKHLQRAQQDIAKLNVKVDTKVDSLGNMIEELRYTVEQIEQLLKEEIRDLASDVRTLSDDYDNFKRKTGRDFRGILTQLSTMKDDIKAINNKLAEETQKSKK